MSFKILLSGFGSRALKVGKTSLRRDECGSSLRIRRFWGLANIRLGRIVGTRGSMESQCNSPFQTLGGIGYRGVLYFHLEFF